MCCFCLAWKPSPNTTLSLKHWTPLEHMYIYTYTLYLPQCQQELSIKWTRCSSLCRQQWLGVSSDDVCPQCVALRRQTKMNIIEVFINMRKYTIKTLWCIYSYKMWFVVWERLRTLLETLRLVFVTIITIEMISNVEVWHFLVFFLNVCSFSYFGWKKMQSLTTCL